MEQSIQRQMELNELTQERGMGSTLLAELEDQEAAAFESDPEAWKNPHFAPAYYQTLLESFEERYDEMSLFEGTGKALENATEEFEDYSMALWEQMFRDKDPQVPSVVDLEEFRTLPLPERAVIVGNLDQLLKKVFDWMISDGKTPIPGLSQWETLLPPKVEAYLRSQEV